MGSEELKWLSDDKWLKTRHGFRTLTESILSGSKWGTITYFVDLPIIDDGYYGIGLYKLRDELNMLVATTDFESGAELVLKGLNSPIELEFIL